LRWNVWPAFDWNQWLVSSECAIAIDRRIYRVELGNFGDHKPCREGVWELRIDVGPGYRVYYAQAGQTVVLLLCGGIKRSQDADISKACGGVSKVAEKAQLNGTHIYRTLSAKGNPELRSLSAILKTMGLRLAVQPIQHPTAHA
jgi:putative addiction module killer protein